MEVHNSEAFTALENKMAALELELEQTRIQLHEAVMKYGFELHLNSELIDILREHDIPFRPALDRAKERFK